MAGTSDDDRRRHAVWPVTVTAVCDLSAHLRRVTLAADRFEGFSRRGPDECFGLMIPTGHRPHLRWYTVRAHRPDRGEIDVDVVLHGHAGPGVEWASRTRPGDVVGYRQSGSAYRGPSPRGSQLLLADETALPALAAILESRPAGSAGIRALVELPDDSYADPATVRAGTTLGIGWLHRGDRPPGSRLLGALHELAAGPDLDYAWVCGESAVVKAARRHLVQGGTDRRRITFAGYWRRPRLLPPAPDSAQGRLQQPLVGE